MLRGMRHVCNLVQRSSSQDSHGQVTGSDTTVASGLFCSIVPLAGRQMEIANQLYPSATVTITCVVEPSWGINTDMSFVEASTSKRFEIGYVKDEDRFGTFVECLCSEVVR